ncbi:Cytochrome c [Methylorubrum populi]
MQKPASFLIATAIFVGLGMSMPAAQVAQPPHLQRGRAFVQTHCARCHATGRVGESPLAEAPRFRDLHHRYPVAQLAESLAEGIRTGHPGMPEFQLDPGQVNDVIGYLESLER